MVSLFSALLLNYSFSLMMLKKDIVAADVADGFGDADRDLKPNSKILTSSTKRNGRSSCFGFARSKNFITQMTLVDLNYYLEVDLNLNMFTFRLICTGEILPVAVAMLPD